MNDKERQQIMMSVIYASHDMIHFQTRQERVQNIAYALEQIGVGYLKAFEYADVIANVIETHPSPRQGLIREVNTALHTYAKENMNKTGNKGVA